jgi:hypothetical protein
LALFFWIDRAPEGNRARTLESDVYGKLLRMSDFGDSRIGRYRCPAMRFD